MPAAEAPASLGRLSPACGRAVPPASRRAPREDEERERRAVAAESTLAVSVRRGEEGGVLRTAVDAVELARAAVTVSLPDSKLTALAR